MAQVLVPPLSLTTINNNVVGTTAQQYTQFLPLPPNALYAFNQFSMPAVGPDGAVYVTWTAENPGGGANGSAVYLKKLPLAGSWSNQFTVANCTYLNSSIGASGSALRVGNNPSLIVGPDSYVYVAFNDNVSSRVQIKFYKSSDPTTVSFTSTNLNLTVDVPQPWLTIDPNGRITLQYYQTTDSGKTVNDYIMSSGDHGSTFGNIKKVSNQSFNVVNQIATYDYEGIVSIGTTGKVFCLWTDARNGNSDPYFASASTISLANVANWSMLGIPDYVGDFSQASVFPRALSILVYNNNGGYNNAPNPLANYVGYFEKDPATTTTLYQVGNPIYSGAMQVVGISANTDGWNIVGSITKSVSTSSVVQNPTNNVLSSYFKYFNSSGYVAVTTLDPGLGFYVKVNSNGTLSLSSSSPKVSAPTVEEAVAFSDKFTITEARGQGQSFYFRNGKFNFSKVDGSDEHGNLELPPPPPSDIFSARPATGYYLQSIESTAESRTVPVLVKYPVYPIRISWNIQEDNNINYGLLLDGKLVTDMRGSSSILIPNPKSIAFQIQAGTPLLPANFSLEQSYPNPFNPVTNIHYQLPVDSKVTLRVFDVLGREVTTLIDGVQPAGQKLVNFDGTNLASGLYYYRLQADAINGNQAGKFVDVKKMLLMK